MFDTLLNIILFLLASLLVCLLTLRLHIYIKGTVMQIEKALINDRLRVSKGF